MPKFSKYNKNDESTKLYVLPSKGSPPTSGNALAISVYDTNLNNNKKVVVLKWIIYCHFSHIHKY